MSGSGAAVFGIFDGVVVTENQFPDTTVWADSRFV